MTQPSLKPSVKREYVSIQVLRAVAAASVVLFHLLPFEEKYLSGRSIVPTFFGFGEIGVDLFFVISGFIITSSTRGLFRDSQKAVTFLLRRFTRVYPIYWVYCIVLLLGYVLDPNIFSGLRGTPDVFASFLLLPTRGASLLLVSWSLTFEIQFYLLFAIALIVLPERRLMPAAGCWALLIVARHLFIDHSLGVFDLLFDLFNLEFLAGCGLARVAGRVPKAAGLLSFVLGIVVLVGGWMVFVQADGKIEQGWPRLFVGGGGFALLLLAAVVWEDQVRKVVPRIIVALGDSSYSLYLSHLLTCALVGYAWKKVLPSPEPAVHLLALGTAFAAALAAGWLSFRLLEQPLQRMSRLVTHSRRRPKRGVVEVG